MIELKVFSKIKFSSKMCETFYQADRVKVFSYLYDKYWLHYNNNIVRLYRGDIEIKTN